jgi:hypothetical protein
VKAYHDYGIIHDPTWEAYMRKHFTTSPLFIRNKLLRLKIFGKLDKNGNHAVMINNTILPIYHKLRDLDGISESIISVEGDEILLSSSQDRYSQMLIMTLLENIGFGHHVRISCFRLLEGKLTNETDAPDFYIRQFLNPVDKTKPFDIKCISKERYRQAYLAASSILSV